MNPLAQTLDDVVNGRFPAVDGGWTRVPLWRSGVEGVVALTGHAFLAVAEDVSDRELAALDIDGFGGATHPRVAMTLAGSGYIECFDMLFAARAGAPQREPLVARPDLIDHPRARLAASLRDDVQVLGNPDPSDRSLITLSRGIAGLWELGIERDPHSAISAETLVQGARANLQPSETVLAACSPGNSRAVKLFLRCGFQPLGSVQLWLPARP